MPEPTLHVHLECELPRDLSVGRGTTVFVCGWCFCREARIRSLQFLLDGEPQPVMAQGMPRLDPFQALHPDLDLSAVDRSEDSRSLEDPGLHSYRSGFWGLVRVDPGAGEDRVISLRAWLEDGRPLVAELSRIKLSRGPEPIIPTWPSGARGPRVAICLATYDPPPDLLERQLESIRAQTHGNWVCIVSDDCSSSDRFSALKAALEGDRRFVISRAHRRLGFYHNFERALAMVPATAHYVAMADQDDAWHPDKLATLLSAIGDAQLVYSDARVVSRAGELISETWWTRRRNNHSDLLSLLVANAVTGAASLLRRDLLDYALPFPPGQFAHFHDHWIGLVALAIGDIAYVDRPLYDYVQHSSAALGHTAANQMPLLRDRLRHQRELRERIRMWRLHYFVDVCRLLQFATVLELRCSASMSPRKRRALKRFIATENSIGSLLELGARGARELVGRRETLGAEWMLFHAFVWRRLLGISTRGRPESRLRLDAVPPPSLALAPGRTGVHASARLIAEKIAPLRWAVSDEAPVRINLLIPTIDLQHFFGGYIAKLNLARRLAELGLRVRIVTVDPVGALPTGWRRTLESYGGLEGLFDKVELALGRESSGLEVNRSDSFIATTWWTAHIASQAVRSLGSERFLYLIQEYEPFTFPMGSYAALAEQSYRLPHYGLFSSELLRDYFRRHWIGVYASGEAAGDSASRAFQNAITDVDPLAARELAQRHPRKLLFYARPEPHAARNMFELGVLALARALEDGVFQSGWAMHGIGTVDRARAISLGGGAALDLLPRSDQGSYAKLLRDHDVGLALMYTPHPSLVPIEMASAGMMTVTNSFENKTPAAMEAISPNLITVDPSVEAIADGLARAAAAATDVERRVAGSAVRWSRGWDESFDPRLLSWVRRAMGC